ncbi:MAG TPA: type II toxin-antitoxin system RelE/ParE family toxin [Candidatus Aminicenantes bacterium]|nr:type II toxin-antitoxin system RelE/ParE family toxin [Candidatus Aminicenantes bacterium]
MSHVVYLTEDAARDLQEIVAHVTERSGANRADRVLNEFTSAFASLAEFPERGVCPRELRAVGLREYREIFFKPYRIIYRALSSRVVVLVIADGRRDMQALLLRRMLQA